MGDISSTNPKLPGALVICVQQIIIAASNSGA